MKKVVEHKISPYLDERELQIQADFEWCYTNREVRRKYGGMIVVAYKGKIWGAGKSFVDAWKQARRKKGCPEKGYASLVVVPYLVDWQDLP